MEEKKHSDSCNWPEGKPCIEYSTDGSWLGAHIAHTMGTTSEEEIVARTNLLGHTPEEEEEIRGNRHNLDAEQKEWDGQGRCSDDCQEDCPWCSW